YLFWSTHAPERMRRLAVLQKRSVCLIIHSTGAMKLGHNDSRVHLVDPYPFRRKLKRRAPSQLIDRRLADAISKHAGERPRPGNTRHVHDVPSRALKVGHSEPHQMKHRAQVDVQHLVPKLE